MGVGKLKEKDVTTEKALECEKLTYQDDKGVAFSNLSWQVNVGESHVILSTPRLRARTFLRVCSTLLPPTSGRITWLGMDVKGRKRTPIEEIRRQIGFVHRGTTLVSNMTLVDNLTLGISYHHNFSPEKAYDRIRGLMERLDLVDYQNMRPVELSYPRQRLAVYAREMAKRPRLYIFDSPMLDLDKEFPLVMEEIDRQRKQKATTVLMSDLPDRTIKQWADYVLLIQEESAQRFTADQFDPNVHFLASTGVWAND